MGPSGGAGTDAIVVASRVGGIYGVELGRYG
jgi:hypothetical protein